MTMAARCRSAGHNISLFSLGRRIDEVMLMRIAELAGSALGTITHPDNRQVPQAMLDRVIIQTYLLSSHIYHPPSRLPTSLRASRKLETSNQSNDDLPLQTPAVA